MRLKDLREDHDLSQKVLSLKLNIAQNTYSQYENGIRQVPVSMLMQLADLYHTSIDYLVERTDEPRPYPKSRRTKIKK